MAQLLKQELVQFHSINQFGFIRSLSDAPGVASLSIHPA